MDYLVFQTEAEANAALDAIYANMVAAITAAALTDVTTGEQIPADEVSPDEAVEYAANNRRFPVFGVNAATGVKDSKNGYTIAWAVAQATLQGRWVFQKPDETLMDGVMGYEVQPFDPNWFSVDILN